MTKTCNKNLIISLLLSALGVSFLIYYIFRASLDVVSSDYIRVINYYINDVTDLKYLLSWEGISRIPFTFLARYINVIFFKYSVFFDKILGVFGLFIFNIIITYYVLEVFNSKILKAITSVVCTYISFSLMSWEMILNGTGYVHFIFIGLVAVTFYIYQQYVYADKELYIPLLLLVSLSSLLFGGSYCVSFLCTIIFFSVILFLKSTNVNIRFIEANTIHKTVRAKSTHKQNHMRKKCEPLSLIIISLVCLLCFIKSSNTGEILTPVGVKDITLIELLKTNPTFPIRFFIKSLASSIIGVETFDYALNFGTIDEKMIYLIGSIYLVIIIITFILIIKMIVGTKVKIITLPIIFFVYGMANYVLVFLARYNFVRDEYGMSSRYSIQYMFLTISTILTLCNFLDDAVGNNAISQKNVGARVARPYDAHVGARSSMNILLSVICTASVFFILLGHITTNTDEIFKADYRIYSYRNLEEKARHYENLSNEELEALFEYRRDADHIKAALMTLKNQKLNIFKYK